MASPDLEAFGESFSVSGVELALLSGERAFDTQATLTEILASYDDDAAGAPPEGSEYALWVMLQIAVDAACEARDGVIASFRRVRRPCRSARTAAGRSAGPHEVVSLAGGDLHGVPHR